MNSVFEGIHNYTQLEAHSHRPEPPFQGCVLTFSPAMMHSDSISTARDSFKHRSSMRATSVATGDGLPTSNPGEAIGESSMLKKSSPSVGL